jgi:hypothetical protein
VKVSVTLRSIPRLDKRGRPHLIDVSFGQLVLTDETCGRFVRWLWIGFGPGSMSETALKP